MSNGGKRNFDLLMTKISNFVYAFGDPKFDDADLKHLREQALTALETLNEVYGKKEAVRRVIDASRLPSITPTLEGLDLQRCEIGPLWE